MATFMWFLATSCLLMSMVNADTDHGHKIVKPGEDMTLWPNIEKVYAVNKWSFETCEGCRIVLSCVILVRDCEQHILTIDDGYNTTSFCGDGVDYALRSSYKNKISLKIETSGLKSGSFCRLLVTKPYTNMNYQEKDSSEDGLGRGATRQPTCRCGWTNKSPGRIVGGYETGVNEFPFAVLIILKRKNYPFCGGSIITPYHVLTAAHCTKPVRGLRLAAIVGEHDTRIDRETPYTKVIDVEQTYEHPNFKNKDNHYDISIMKLKQRIEFNDAVGPVCLPSFSDNKLLDEYVKVMGWGYLETNGSESPVLRKVNLKVLEFDICKTMFASVQKNSTYQLCTWAPDRDSCQGDSGGPVVWQNSETKRLTQVGVVSFGRNCGSLDPAVNTDVSYFMDWIRQTVRDTAPEEICM